MNILILGGTRFFGKRLAHILLLHGHTVTVASRGNVADDLGDSVSRIIVDRSNMFQMTNVFKKKTFDIVFDQLAFSAKDIEVSNEALGGRVGRYILTSSLAAYMSYGKELRETDIKYRPLLPSDPGKEYGKGKQDAEYYLFNNTKFNSVAVRLPYVLGMDDWLKRLEFHVAKIVLGEPIYFSNIDAKFSPILSEDAAESLSKLVNIDHVGGINVCPSEPISLRQMVEFISYITNKPAIIANSPAEFNRSPYDAEQDWYMDSSLMARLGFSCRGIREWLPELILSQYNLTRAKIDHH